ncbi:MAG: PilN domain-containing protein [Burkholderiaceae bacterium]
MIKINLLPHREEKRKKRQNEFYAMLGLAGTAAALMVILIGFGIGNKISEQEQRNTFIKTENARLDIQIKEISTLKQDIEALKARQQAVEDLQGDRNQPVYLMDELVKQTPEGVYLRAFKQDGQRVVMNGYAQSNERVSEFLRNLSNNSAWLNLPELIEIRSTNLGQGKDTKRIFEFTVNVGIKRPRDKDQAEIADVSPAKP